MLKIQEALLSGKTPEDLTTELAVTPHRHPTLPLTGFVYNQIDSPKTNPIVREARGLVLENDTWRLVGKSFDRFFNAGEVAEEYATFNWNSFTSTTKADGSLILLFNYQGTWIAKTKGSFGDGTVPFPLPGETTTFAELFWQLASKYNLDTTKLNPNYTYILELCTLKNKVVRSYQESKLYLLSIIETATLKEHSEVETSAVAKEIGVDRPEVYHFGSYDEILLFLQKQEKDDPTYEGVVIRDSNNLRYKIKSKTYLALHAMSGNGNILLPKYQMPFVLKEDPAELLTYFPEAEESLAVTTAKVATAWEVMLNVWKETHHIAVQKDFAKAIVGKTPFTGLLFGLRQKTGKRIQGGFEPGPQTEADLKALWRDSGDMILKILF